MSDKIVYLNRSSEMHHRDDVARCGGCGAATFKALFFTTGQKGRLTISAAGEHEWDEASDSEFDSHCYISGYCCERCGQAHTLTESGLAKISGPLRLEDFIEHVSSMRHKVSDLLIELELLALRVPLTTRVKIISEGIFKAIGALAANGWWDEGLEFLRNADKKRTAKRPS